MNFLDALNRQDFACGLAGELVGAVARADGNREGIELRCTHKFGSLIRVRQEHVARQFSFGAVTVFFRRLQCFKGADAAEFAFDGNAD